MNDLEVLLLSLSDIHELRIDPEVVTQELRHAYVEFAKGNYQLPPKQAIHLGADRMTYLHSMPAYVDVLETCGLKWLTRTFDNSVSRAFPQFTGVQMVNDSKTGMPRAIMDCSWITATRTTAVSVLSAEVAAVAEPEVLSIFGTGVQALFHATMFSQRYPSIHTIHIVSHSDERALAFAQRLTDELHVHCVASDSVSALAPADISIFSGWTDGDIEADYLKTGSLAISLEIDRPWADTLWNRAGLVITDDSKQFWDRYHHDTVHRPAGVKFDYELPQLLLREQRIEPLENGFTISMNVGLGIADLAVADLIFRRAQDAGVGRLWRLLDSPELLPPSRASSKAKS